MMVRVVGVTIDGGRGFEPKGSSWDGEPGISGSSRSRVGVGRGS